MQNPMSPSFPSIVGVLLMAGCGSALGRHMGLTGFDQVLVAGFAMGIFLLAQTPAIVLRKRVVALEALLADRAVKEH